MSVNPMGILANVIGAFVAGEALALWIGVVVRYPDSPWVTKTVRILLVLDIASGAALAAGADSSILLISAAAVVLATHAYRTWEVVSSQAERFCFNRRLFWFNNIKLLGAATVIMLWAVSL